jgi:hypothetical protein
MCPDRDEEFHTAPDIPRCTVTLAAAMNDGSLQRSAAAAVAGAANAAAAAAPLSNIARIALSPFPLSIRN